MHAWLCDQPTGPDALKWTELPTPEPRRGQVRVAIRCASFNFPDLLIVQNKYQVKPALPFVPGSEFSGVIEAVGEGVTALQPGMAVASFGGLGGFADAACVPVHLRHQPPCADRSRRLEGRGDRAQPGAAQGRVAGRCLLG